jgi:hypothetical protein
MASKKFLTPVNLLNLSEDPATGAQGDLYFNTASQKLRKYTSSGWSDVEASASSGVIDISSEVPTTPVLGRAWFDNESGSFYVYDGTYWVQINGIFENPPYNEEQVFDSAASLLDHSNHENIIVTYDDNNDQVILSTTGNVTGIDSISSPDFIQFDTTSNVTPVTGMLGWDSVEGTLNLGLSSNKHIHVGEESVYRVRNATGSTISKGTALYASGVESSGRIQVTQYVADGSVREVRFMGLATENINNGVNGFVQHFGYVSNLDTRGTSSTAISVGDETWAAGDILYVHPTVPGKLTNIKPTHAVVVAIIIIRHQTTGILFVRPSSGGHLEDIHDILISGPEEDQVLKYDNESGLWKNTHPNIITARNVTENTVSAFTPVYINTQEFEQDNITFAPADASSSMYLANLPADAITVEDVDSDEYTKLVTMGTVTGADLTGYSVGQNLYVAVGGGLTGTRPTGTNAIQPFARVLSVDNGTIYVYGNTFVSSVENLPNLGSDKIWIGNSGRPVETSLSTSVVPEGNNLYYTDERAQDAAAQMFEDGAHNGISVEYVDESSLFNLTNTGVTSIYGTAYEIEVSSATGSTTLSFPTEVYLPEETTIGDVTSGEIANLSGTSSNIQDQLDDKASLGHSHSSGDVTDFDTASIEAIVGPVTSGENINVSVTYDSLTNTFVFVGAETYNDGMAQDAAAEAITGATHSGISVEYDDVNYLLSFSNDGVLSVDGTTNQISASTVDGATTLSLPSSIVTPGTLEIDSTTQSTSSLTGALIVSGGVGIAKDVWIDGNLHVAGTTVTENTKTVATSDNLIYLNAAQDTTITNAVGNGTSVTYTAENSYEAGMDIRVTGMNPSGYNISSADGLTILSATSTQFVVTKTTTGTFVSGGTAHAKYEVNPDLGFAGGYYDGGYAHAGLFRDASDGVFKFFQGYTLEPDEAVNIDTADASFDLADISVGTLFGNTVVAEELQSTGQQLTLNFGQTGTPSLDASLTVERGSGPDVAIRWNETTNMWEFTNDGVEYKGFGSGGGVKISNDPPTEELVEGLAWFEIETGRLYVYDGTFWVEASNNLNDEAVMDIISTMIANGTHSNIEITYADSSNALSFNVLSEPITDFLTLNEEITGTPTGNAGIIVNRGDLTDVAIRFNETEDQWEYTNDGAEYQSIGSGGGAVSTMTALSNSFWLGA